MKNMNTHRPNSDAVNGIGWNVADAEESSDFRE